MIDFYDNSLWHCDDKKWVDKRKQEWKSIRKVLESMNAGKPPQRELIFHKEYFLFGKEPSQYLHLLYRLWYYPGDLQSLLINMWCDSEISTSEINRTRMKFLGDISRLGVSDVDADYGYLGGREKIFAHFFVPPDYSEETVERKYEQYRLSPWPADFFLETACNGLLFITADHTYSYINAYQTFQYLLDHFFSCFRYLGDNVSADVECSFVRLLEATKNYKMSDEDTILAKNANKFVEKFVTKLESDEATDYVKAKWNEIKKAKS